VLLKSSLFGPVPILCEYILESLQVGICVHACINILAVLLYKSFADGLYSCLRCFCIGYASTTRPLSTALHFEQGLVNPQNRRFREFLYISSHYCGGGLVCRRFGKTLLSSRHSDYTATCPRYLHWHITRLKPNKLHWCGHCLRLIFLSDCWHSKGNSRNRIGLTAC